MCLSHGCDFWYQGSHCFPQFFEPPVTLAAHFFKRCQNFFQHLVGSWIDNKVFHNLQVLYGKLNFTCKQSGLFVHNGFDEGIIHDYRKQGTGHIRGKYFRFGSILWGIYWPEGYLLHVESWCGVDTDLPDTGLGHGADAMLSLIEKHEVKAGSNVKFPNLFTSVLFLDQLTELWANRFHTVPVASKTKLTKKIRGSYYFVTLCINLAVPSTDNKVVTCATTYVTLNLVSTAEWWSHSVKRRVDEPILKTFVY